MSARRRSASVCSSKRRGTLAGSLLRISTARLGRDAPANALFAAGKDFLEAEDNFLLGLGLNRAGRADSALQVWQPALADDQPRTRPSNSLPSPTRSGIGWSGRGLRFTSGWSRQPGWELPGELSLAGLRAELRRSCRGRGSWSKPSIASQPAHSTL